MNTEELENTTEQVATQAVVSSTRRLSFAEFEAKSVEVSKEQKESTIHCPGRITIERDQETGGYCFALVADFAKLTVDMINWKETTTVRAGKPSTSLRGSISVRATMPSDVVIPVILPDGSSKDFKIRPSTQYGADRFIFMSLDPA